MHFIHCMLAAMYNLFLTGLTALHIPTEVLIFLTYLSLLYLHTYCSLPKYSKLFVFQLTISQLSHLLTHYPPAETQVV